MFGWQALEQQLQKQLLDPENPNPTDLQYTWDIYLLVI
jgi:hypothetical protein